MVNTNMVGVFPSTASLREVSIRNRHNGLGRPIKECSPRLIGAYGVDLAAAYLEDQGYHVVYRHWVSRCGTVDLVCVKDDIAVLVEVRSRTARSGHKMYIEDIKVGYRRRNSFRNQAILYLAKHVDQDVARYDIISVQIADGYEASLYHCMGICEVSC